jgi:hypothetical protein
MLSNTIASPFGDLLCLHVVESKNSQPPTEKKNMLPWKTLKSLFVHTQNPKVKNLLQNNFHFTSINEYGLNPPLLPKTHLAFIPTTNLYKLIELGYWNY